MRLTSNSENVLVRRRTKSILQENTSIIMNDLELYTHEIFGSIRIMTDEDGSFLFCGNDVATALGYANSRKAISDLPVRNETLHTSSSVSKQAD